MFLRDKFIRSRVTELHYATQANQDKMINISTYDEAVHLDEETTLKQSKIIEHFSILKDEHHTDDKEWFFKLVQNCH